MFLAWARVALAAYPLRAPRITFLGHSDNITFRVKETGGGLYLLRLHKPSLAYWTGVRQIPEFIASELIWLEALAESGFDVQHPLRTREGQLVASVDLDGAEFVPATLLTWLDGEHFSAAVTDEESVQAVQAEIEQFGALVGRLHDFSAHWSPPAGFARPSYDEDHFRHIFARLLRGLDLGVFSQDVYWTLRAAAGKILDEIRQIPVEPDTWGMIHADLHMGNFLVQEDADRQCIVPIDFSFCGFGHYLFDLSVCLSGGLNPALRPAFLRGYRTARPLEESSLRAIEAYQLAGKLSYFAYQIENPVERAWLQRRLADVVENDCARFIKAVD